MNSSIHFEMVKVRPAYRLDQPLSDLAAYKRKPRIVLAERDMDLRALMRSCLTLQGYEALPCGDRACALRIFQHTVNVDLLIADIPTTDIAGLELVVEATHLRPLLPIIITSHREPAASLREFMASNGWTFMRKPYGIRKMLSAVHRQMYEGARTARHLQKQIQDFSIC